MHISHNVDDALRADRVVRMREGRVVSDRVGAARPTHGGGAAAGGSTAGAPSIPPVVTRGRQAVLEKPGPPILQVRGAAHVYAAGTPWEHPTLSGIDLDLAPGDGLLITGENGSGKTTLAWMLAGLLRPTAGTCELDGRPVADQIGSVALAFQHARLQLQKRSVREDILSAAGPRARGTDPARFVERWLGAMGLPAALADRNIDALSGGQQRRVAIAGILASEPRVLVLDEPFAGLDPASRSDLVATLAAVREERNLAIVVISHDLAGIEQLCPRVLHLPSGSPK